MTWPLQHWPLNIYYVFQMLTFKDIVEYFFFGLVCSLGGGITKIAPDEKKRQKMQEGLQLLQSWQKSVLAYIINII